MNILIAGASGFVGGELVNALKNSHQITVLGRDKSRLQTAFPATIKQVTWDELSELDAKSFQAVINLCGYNISQSRWSESVKHKIISSRTKTNHTLVRWLVKQQAKAHFISANAVGIYGIQDINDTTAYDETYPIPMDKPKDFLSEIGVAWQKSAQEAAGHEIPVTTLRFGVVLKHGQGMLKKIEMSFQLGLGAQLGNGKQILSWIHIDDLIQVIDFSLAHPELTGAFNTTSPHPVEQKVFAKTLAQTMHRPQFLILPAFVVKLLFGEMGESLLLSGQRVVPKRLLDCGFKFQYPTLESALKREYGTD